MTEQVTEAPQEAPVATPEIEVTTAQEAQEVSFTDHQEPKDPVQEAAAAQEQAKTAEQPKQEQAPEEPKVDPKVQELEDQIVAMHKQSIFGSEEEYQAATQWGAENLSQGELDLYNEVVETGTPAQAQFAMRALHAMAAQGRMTPAAQPQVQDGRPVEPAGSAPIGLQPFASDVEMAAAMADPRYHRSDAVGEAYRAEVARRVYMM